LEIHDTSTFGSIETKYNSSSSTTSSLTVKHWVQHSRFPSRELPWEDL